jgi:nucleoside-diphosphate-sugar epimerase
LEGTLGILKACLNSKTVKRVVYTSSAAAILFSGNGQEVVDESAWTDMDYFKDLKLTARSYTASKTKTERAALEFAEQHGLDLVTLIPSLVLGPFNSPRIPASFYVGLAMIMGMITLFNKKSY